MASTLLEQLNDNEYELMVEALFTLRERKVAALQEAGKHEATRSFTARDFGVPKIDALLARLDAKPPQDQLVIVAANTGAAAMATPVTPLEEALAEACRSTRDCLQGWMAIQDEDDARDYDTQAVEAANAALATYDAKIASVASTTVEQQNLPSCEPGEDA